jgi:hypothetical protein
MLRRAGSFGTPLSVIVQLNGEAALISLLLSGDVILVSSLLFAACDCLFRRSSQLRCRSVKGFFQNKYKA